MKLASQALPVSRGSYRLRPKWYRVPARRWSDAVDAAAPMKQRSH
jgi:hypothetical protein